MSKDSVRYGRVPKRSREKSQDIQVTLSEIVEKPMQNPKYREIMYDIIVTISEAHLLHCPFTEEKTQGLIRKPALVGMPEHQHLAMEGQNGFGNMEFQKIIMWQQFTNFLNPCIQPVVEFAKRIPGFQELTQDDKLRVIKLGFFEVWVIHSARLINLMDNTVTFSDGSYISRQQMEIMFDRDFVTSLFNFAMWFNDLRLSDCEIGLYCAIVLMTAERQEIYGHKLIQQLQEKLIEALKFQVSEDHPNDMHVFATLVSKLPEVRVLGEKHQEHLKWFKANWMHLNLSPLFAEVFDFPKSESDLANR